VRELAASADRLAALRREVTGERAARNALIADLRGLGVTYGQIARAARLSPTRCFAIAAAMGA